MYVCGTTSVHRSLIYRIVKRPEGLVRGFSRRSSLALHRTGGEMIKKKSKHLCVRAIRFGIFLRHLVFMEFNLGPAHKHVRIIHIYVHMCVHAFGVRLSATVRLCRHLYICACACTTVRKLRMCV